MIINIRLGLHSSVFVKRLRITSSSVNVRYVILLLVNKYLNFIQFNTCFACWTVDVVCCFIRLLKLARIAEVSLDVVQNHKDVCAINVIKIIGK